MTLVLILSESGKIACSDERLPYQQSPTQKYNLLQFVVSMI